MDYNSNIGNSPCQTLIEQFFEGISLRRLDYGEARRRRLGGLPIIQEGEYLSYTNSMTDIDYRVSLPTCNHLIGIDTKDKKIFIPKNWGIPEKEKHDWFIFDETSVKKILNIGCTSFMVLNDFDTKSLYLWSSQSIGLSHRRWAMRTTDNTLRKYKLLYHVSGCEVYDTWEDLTDRMIQWVNTEAYDTSHSGSSHTWYRDVVDLSINTQHRSDFHRVRDLSSQGGAQ